MWQFCFISLIGLALLGVGCGKRESARGPAEDLAAGWDYFRLGEFESAAKRFERASANSAARHEALYALATAWNLRRPDEDVAKARALYERIIREAPQSDWAAWSELALARLTHLVPADQIPDFAAVERAYQGVRDRHPGHPAAREALWFQQSARLYRRDKALVRQAVTELEQFIAAEPGSPFVGGAYSLLATAREILREPEAELAALLQALARREVDPQNPKPDLSGTYWRIALIAEVEVGDWATARQYYRQLVAEYPRDFRVHPAKLALARMDAQEAKWREGTAP